MKLVAHASPSVLEAELLDRVAAAKTGNPLAPVLIVVPSKRLADHVSHRLVETFGAVLGVTVLHHRALAERVVESAGARRPRVLEDSLLDTLFSRVVERAAAGPIRSFVQNHPDAAVALRTTVNDLREAGLTPSAVMSEVRGDDQETAALYARWSSALDELADNRGAGDDAGLVRTAIPHAEAFAAPFAAVFHHGAYDLIGVRSELVRALDRGKELTFFLPANPTDDSGIFGMKRALAIASPEKSTALDREITRAPVSWLHAQGARAELRNAAYEALASVAAGAPPHDVAIVVRTFGPYAAAMDALLDELRLDWNTSYVQPLRRSSSVAAALRAIDAMGDGGPRRWSEHAEAFASISGDAMENQTFSRLLQCVREIETLLGDDRLVTRSEARGWLEAGVDAATVPAGSADATGVRILDAMQARGLTFTHLNLAGLNGGIFPLVDREDPFLSDDSRRRLRDATGCPLPIAAERDDEERLLLAMLLGSSRKRISVSWQRADESARPMVASLALDAIASFAGLDPDTTDISKLAEALPAHPLSRLSAWGRNPALLDPRDETLLCALAAEAGASSGPAVAERRPELTPGIALVAATETFQQTAGHYDGRIGVSVRGDSLSASAFERLGSCPLRFFFEYVLKVRAPETPPTPFTQDVRKVGTRVHQVLQRVYEGLGKEGAFREADLESRVERAMTILREIWDKTADEEDLARAAQYPLLVRIERDEWFRTLDAFFREDLGRLAKAGLVPTAFEQKVAKTIPGGPPGLAIRARFDRVLTGDSATVVSDYKTGRDLAKRTRVGEMLSGSALQVPIYALIANASVELLGVGRGNEPETAVFTGFKTDTLREGFLETLQVTAALAETGRFPIHPGDHCRNCDHRTACRHDHPPTEFREELASDVRDARDCWSKSAKAPFLSDVRGEGAP